MRTSRQPRRRDQLSVNAMQCDSELHRAYSQPSPSTLVCRRAEPPSAPDWHTGFAAVPGSVYVVRIWLHVGCAPDIVLELLDEELFLVDGRLDHVTDRDEPGQLVFLQDG